MQRRVVSAACNSSLNHKRLLANSTTPTCRPSSKQSLFTTHQPDRTSAATQLDNRTRVCHTWGHGHTLGAVPETSFTR